MTFMHNVQNQTLNIAVVKLAHMHTVTSTLFFYMQEQHKNWRKNVARTDHNLLTT